MPLAMTRSLAERLSVVAPSATLAMGARAAKLRGEGHKVYPFSVGEPDFDTPAHIREAAKAALDAGATHYTAVTGTAELKSAICAATERDRGWRPTPGQVVVSCGVKHVLFNLALALYEPGDEVIIPAPFWVSYPEQVRLVGAKPVIVTTSEEGGFRMTPDQLAAALSPRTKAVLLCSPSNPTGAGYSEDHLRALLDVLRKHDCWIIVDEIYGDLIYDGFKHVSIATLAEELRDRIIILDGVSKTYAMTGWRIGWSITASGSHARARRRARSEHHQPGRRLAGRRGRSAQRSSRRGARDARRLHPPPQPHGERLELSPGRPLSHAGRRLLRVPVLRRPHRQA